MSTLQQQIDDVEANTKETLGLIADQYEFVWAEDLAGIAPADVFDVAQALSTDRTEERRVAKQALLQEALEDSGMDASEAMVVAAELSAPR